MTDIASPTRKVFVGIKVPMSLAQLMADFRRTQSVDDEDIRWADSNDLHITVKFIGSVPATMIAPIIDKLKGISSPCFEVCISGADIFQDAGVLVVDMHGTPELLSLQAAVAEALRTDLGWQNDRVYRAHITLARWNTATATTSQQINHDVMRIKLDEYCRALPAKNFSVNKLILYETVSGRYRIVEEFRLAD